MRAYHSAPALTVPRFWKTSITAILLCTADGENEKMRMVSAPVVEVIVMTPMECGYG